jgi:hypothetical protein
MFISGTVFFGICLFYALTEIEIEGKSGWAFDLPTWYRTRGKAAKIFGMFCGQRPLTGYNLFMNLFILLVFHLPFAIGFPWSMAMELKLMSRWLLFWATIDFLWFVLNPAFTLKKFCPEEIWWHRKTKWIAKKFPADYLISLVLSFFLSLGAYLCSGAPLNKYLLDLFVLGLGILLTIVCAPAYHKWYNRMREEDHRNLIQK